MSGIAELVHEHDETTSGQMAARIKKIEAMDGRVSDEMRRLWRASAESFGRQNNFTLSARPFTLSQLAGRPSLRRERIPCGRIFDHAEFFRTKRRPAAIVAHSYASRDRIAQVVEGQGLDLRFLAASWYFPQGCNAFVVTRPQ